MAGGRARLHGCAIRENEASGQGGGVHVSGSGVATLGDGTLVAANRANGGTAGEWPPLEWSLLLAQSPAVPPALRALLEAMLEPAERPRLRERGPRIAELGHVADNLYTRTLCGRATHDLPFGAVDATHARAARGIVTPTQRAR